MTRHIWVIERSILGKPFTPVDYEFTRKAADRLAREWRSEKDEIKVRVVQYAPTIAGSK